MPEKIFISWIVPEPPGCVVAGRSRLERPMRVEPVPRLVGHLAVPGRQVDLPPRRPDRRDLRRRDADLRLRPLGRHRGDDRGGPRARRRGLRARRRDAARLRQGPPTGLRAPAGADRLRERRHARAADRRASSPARSGRTSSSRATSRSRGGRWGGSRSRSRGWGRRSRPPRASCRSRSRAAGCAAIDYALPVASAQVKSAILLAGLFADGRDDRRRAGCRPATTPSGCSPRRARASRAGRRA